MKAVALFSGGLDSSLAAKVISKQGIDVKAVNFTSSIFSKKDKTLKLAKMAEKIGIGLEIFDITDEFLNVVTSPQFGRGSNLNPCIDCKIFMLRKAKKYMQEIGASFVITGEVLGQRPMSQHKQALQLIARESGLEGLLLRPLSAKLLDESMPEKEGWVDKDKLLDINGRSRKRQMELMSKFGIDSYPNPAGGCLLTEKGYSKRLIDLMKHSQLDIHNIELLKLGRHFRLSPKAKLVVGKDEKENQKLLRLAKRDDFIIEPVAVPGPTAVGVGEEFKDSKILEIAESIVADYCDKDDLNKIEIKYYKISNPKLVEARFLPIAENNFNDLCINK